MPDSRTHTAIFSSPDAVYHADRCEALRAAAKRGEVQLEALARGGYPGRRLPAGVLREVRSVGFWDAPRNQSWGLDWHRNEGIELTYLAVGRVPFALDNKSCMLEPGDLTIARPWQRHRVGNPHVTASRLHWLILDVGVRRPDQPWRWPSWLLCPKAELARLTARLRHNERPVWRADAEIGRCFAKLGEAVARGTGVTNLTRVQIYINELVIALAELLERKNPRLDESLSTTQRTVRMFLNELPQRVAEPWTLDAMAAQCGLGRSYFSHYCKLITNMSPIGYLTRCRVEAAARLLAERPAMNVTEVAFACGFQSSQYFATVFRAQTGRSPRETRERGQQS
jgi:AraC family L-rhamnose operon regulatory protein RhaS